MNISRHREEEPEYFHIYYEDEDTGLVQSNIFYAGWFKGKLEISANASLLTMEEVKDFYEWAKETQPKPEYKIVFKNKPIVIEKDCSYLNYGRNYIITDEDFEIEEVW
jgi:hypothetical protein